MITGPSFYDPLPHSAIPVFQSRDPSPPNHVESSTEEQNRTHHQVRKKKKTHTRPQKTITGDPLPSHRYRLRSNISTARLLNENRKGSSKRHREGLDASKVGHQVHIAIPRPNRKDDQEGPLMMGPDVCSNPSHLCYYFFLFAQYTLYANGLPSTPGTYSNPRNYCISFLASKVCRSVFFGVRMRASGGGFVFSPLHPSI